MKRIFWCYFNHSACFTIYERTKSGKIINISSISGQVGFPGLSPYVSSKYALEGWSESLRLEVKSFGIDVALIEPGSYNTNIWEVGKQLAENQSETTSPYKEYMGKIQKHINSGSDRFGNPIDVAKKSLILLKLSAQHYDTQLEKV